MHRIRLSLNFVELNGWAQQPTHYRQISKLHDLTKNSMVAAIADECVMRLARADCVAMKRSPKIGGAVPARGFGG